MVRLAKQIRQLDHEISQQRNQLLQDYAALKQKVGGKPHLLQGFLWGILLGFLVIAPKIKHRVADKAKVEKVLPKPQEKNLKNISLQQFLFTSLPIIKKLLL